MPDQRDDLARLEHEVDVVKDRAARVVAERDAVEDDVSRARWERDRFASILDVFRLVDHLEDALTRCGCPLRLPDPHSELAQRQHEQREEEVERDEVAE